MIMASNQKILPLSPLEPEEIEGFEVELFLTPFLASLPDRPTYARALGAKFIFDRF